MAYASGWVFMHTAGLTLGRRTSARLRPHDFTCLSQTTRGRKAVPSSFHTLKKRSKEQRALLEDWQAVLKAGGASRGPQEAGRQLLWKAHCLV